MSEKPESDDETAQVEKLIEAARKGDPKVVAGKHKNENVPKAIRPKQRVVPARNQRHGQGQPKGR
jgi:hypothetical protein